MEKPRDKNVMLMKKIGNIFLGLCFLLFITIGIQSMNLNRDADYIPKIFGFTYLNVLSGSMEPHMKPYDLVIGNSVDTSTLKIGDVVTYKDGQTLITHRIIEIQEGNFVTQGDANSVKDSKVVEKDTIVAKEVVVIPKVGYVIAKLQDFKFLGAMWAILLFFIGRELVLEIKKVRKAKKEQTV